MARPGYYWINAITFYRLLSAPVLVILIVTGNFEIFKWMLAASFMTDAIDGYLARLLKVASVFGARLDSIADDLTILAAIIGMIVFKYDFLVKESIVVFCLLFVFVLQMLFAFVRYGRITSFHTYGAKLAAILQGIFILLLFFLKEPVYILFYLAAGVTGLELVEEIIIVVVLPKWQANVKGLYWVTKANRISNK